MPENKAGNKNKDQEMASVEKRQEDGLIEKIWNLFSSMKLGLILLGVVALVAALGTFIPQISQNQTEAEAVGKVWQVLGFTHLYSSAWFRLLLGLLCINLVVCSVQRFGGIYAKTFKPRPPIKPAGIPQKVKTAINGNVATLRPQVEEILRSSGYKITAQETEDGWGFIGIKRRWGNWGSFITHLAFVVLIVGALLGTLIGFQGYLWTPTGETTALKSIEMKFGRVNNDFNIRVNSFEDRIQDNGERDNWYSDITILENGQEKRTGTLSMNHPLTYKGITFYQSGYADQLHFTADINGQKIPVTLPDTSSGSLSYQTMVGNYVLEAEGLPTTFYKVYTINYVNNSLNLIQSGKLKKGQTVDVQGQFKLTLDSYLGYTGLQVKQDPGVTFIWIGSILLLLGLLLSFYWRPMTISGFIQKDDKKMAIGAFTGKVAGASKAEFESVIKKFKED